MTGRDGFLLAGAVHLASQVVGYWLATWLEVDDRGLYFMYGATIALMVGGLWVPLQFWLALVSMGLLIGYAYRHSRVHA